MADASSTIFEGRFVVRAYLSKLGWTNICLSFLSLYYIKVPDAHSGQSCTADIVVV